MSFIKSEHTIFHSQNVFFYVLTEALCIKRPVGIFTKSPPTSKIVSTIWIIYAELSLWWIFGVGFGGRTNAGFAIKMAVWW